MSRIVGRFFIICALLMGVLFAAYQFALEQPGMQADLYRRSQAARMDSAVLKDADPNVLSATPCMHGSCLLVQGSGRLFLVGAGEGAAGGMFSNGALNPRLDGVLLTDLTRGAIEGLPGVRDRTLEAGRKEVLQVFGPSGVERVVDGVNAMLETSDAERTIRYSEGLLPFSAAPVVSADMGGFEDGAVIFDSGVLTIRIINVASQFIGGDALVYRFDQGNQSLIVSGCRARGEDIRKAVELSPKPEHIGLVVAVTSETMLTVQRQEADAAGLRRESRFINAPVEECLTLQATKKLIESMEPDFTLAWPLYPAARTPLEQRHWEKLSRVEIRNQQMLIGQIGKTVSLNAGTDSEGD